MALQASGPISMDDMNTDRTIPSGTQIDLATAGTAYGVSYNTIGTDDLRFSEFYGLSAGAPPSPPVARPIYLSNPPGESSTMAACAITSGLEKFVLYGFAITNGLEIFNEVGLINRTYTSDPYSGQYAWLFDPLNGGYHAVTFDGTGLVNTVYDCVGTPSPPSPPSPAAPPVYYYNATRCDNYTNYIIYGGTNYYGTGTVVISGGTTYCYTIQNEVGVQAYVDTVGASVIDCNDAACYVPPPPPPTPTPPYSYLLNNGGEATGPDACNEYNSSITATYYSNQSSITTGTTLYLSDYVTVVPDGYYSDGTNYWYFVGGATSDLGTSC